MFGATTQEKAYIGPFAVFMGFLLLAELVAKPFDGMVGSWWLTEPKFWVFPLQTAVCGWLLYRGWKYYELGAPQGSGWWIGIGVLVLLLWIAPQQWLGAPKRYDGFNPTYFGESSWGCYVSVVLRFVRLVIVVPLLEEIFWRGFLLRYRLDRSFTEVPFGSFSWLSFAIVTAGFTVVHLPEDRIAAAATGMLYNFVAYRTRSLSACVLAHALTNLLLGIYIMRTGQWGFW
jgi:CAAX prenyl protease-like protein